MSHRKNSLKPNDLLHLTARAQSFSGWIVKFANYNNTPTKSNFKGHDLFSAFQRWLQSTSENPADNHYEMISLVLHLAELPDTPSARLVVRFFREFDSWAIKARFDTTLKVKAVVPAAAEAGDEALLAQAKPKDVVSLTATSGAAKSLSSAVRPAGSAPPTISGPLSCPSLGQYWREIMRRDAAWRNEAKLLGIPEATPPEVAKAIQELAARASPSIRGPMVYCARREPASPPSTAHQPVR
jgi:hypothetical protein